MRDGISGIIESQKQQAEIEDNENQLAQGQYIAFQKSREKTAQIMLEINFNNNTSKQIFYFRIIEFSYQNDSVISIVRPQEIIHIQGRNLHLPKEDFRKNRIQIITEFNPQQFNETPQNDKPIIDEITIELLK